MLKGKISELKIWVSKLSPVFSRRMWLALLLFCCGVFIFSSAMLIGDYLQSGKEAAAFKELAAMVADSTESAVPASDDAPNPQPASQTPVMLEQYRAIYQRNADMAGWIRVDGTQIDYPVMYTGDDFYLSHGFDKAESRSGVPFIDGRCAVGPFGTNTIIYGHHMKSGTMFAGLEKYKDEGFFKQYPTFRFDTLYVQQEYQIIAVFESRIFQKTDTVFKHYNFINAESQAEFDEFIANIHALALYDTGVTASYGDELLTLVTCAYHTSNGQFVVVAKKSGDNFS